MKSQDNKTNSCFLRAHKDLAGSKNACSIYEAHHHNSSIFAHKAGVMALYTTAADLSKSAYGALLHYFLDRWHPKRAEGSALLDRAATQAAARGSKYVYIRCTLRPVSLAAPRNRAFMHISCLIWYVPHQKMTIC